MKFQKGNKVNLGRKRPDMVGHKWNAGRTPWNKGKTGVYTTEALRKMSLGRAGKPSPTKGKKRLDMVLEKNVLWKGDKASYAAKHIWIRYNFGKPKKCEECGEDKKKLNWANISGGYKRDRDDWRQLCIPCHRKYDYSKTKS